MKTLKEMLGEARQVIPEQPPAEVSPLAHVPGADRVLAHRGEDHTTVAELAIERHATSKIRRAEDLAGELASGQERAHLARDSPDDQPGMNLTRPDKRRGDRPRLPAERSSVKPTVCLASSRGNTSTGVH